MSIARVCAALLALAFIFPIVALGQTEPNLEIGFKPHGSFHGSEIDTVGILNGGLTVHIPYPYNYPQRAGKLNNPAYIVINSKSWSTGFKTSDNITVYYWTVGNGGLLDPLFGGFSAESLLPRVQRTVNITVNNGQTVRSVVDYAVRTWDGASHPLVDVSGNGTTFEATDSSGWRVSLPGATGASQDSGVLLDRNGTQYSISGFLGGCGTSPLLTNPSPPPGYPYKPTLLVNVGSASHCGQGSEISAVTDSNGNVYSVPTSTATSGSDTMGRQLSYFGLPQGLVSAVSDTSVCPSGAGNVVSYPGANGNDNQLTICYAPVSIQTNFGISGFVEFPASANYGGKGLGSLISSVVLPDGETWALNYDSYGNVTQLSLPWGGSIKYDYDTVAFPAIDLHAAPASRAVVQRTLSDNRGHSYVWKYQWMVSQSNPSSANGTYTNVVTDPLGHDTVHVFSNLGGAFYETQTQAYQGTYSSGQLLRQTDTTYQVLNLFSLNAMYGPTVLPTSIQTTLGGKVSLVQKSYDAGLSVGANSPNGSLGKVVSEKVYDWGQGQPGALLRETDTTYQWQLNNDYLKAHMLDLPASVIIRDGNGNRLAETDYTYDESQYLTDSNVTTQHGAPPNSVRGNLTTVSHWLNPGNSTIGSHTNWYDTGEVYQQIDSLGNTTTHRYDPFYVGAYSTKTCNALNQCVSGTYDFPTGLLTSLTNANATTQASGNTPGDDAHTSQYFYDSMDRVIWALSPVDPLGNSPQTTFNYPNATTVERLHKIAPGLTDDSFTYFDGLGRISQSKHVLPGGSNALVDTTYDGLDRVASVTNPYFNGNDLTYGITQNQFDGLGRRTQTTHQDGSISTISYADNCTTTSDEAGKQRRACTDALGRLTTVWEDPNGLNYETDYQYDALGNLLRVDQKGSAPTDSTQWRTRLFTYDSLSRLLTANNPESGLISYVYDNNGNLTQKVMPTPNQIGIATHTISYCYDTLNRVTGKAYSWQNCQSGKLPQGTAAVTYNYDEGTNGIGHLTSLTDDAGSATYSFDILGRMASENRTIIGVTKSMSYTYNLDGSVATMTYPSGAVLSYTPDSAGRLVSVVDTTSTANPINYVTGATYNAPGLLTGSTYGQNGSFTGIVNQFSFNNRLQPVNLWSSSPTKTLMNLIYDFHVGNGDNGNVYAITNNRDTSRSQTFTYDALNRLLSAQNAGTDCSQTLPDGHTEYWGNNYVYDAWGNLKQKQVTKCVAENLNSAVNANNRLQSYDYDSAGNMTKDNNGTNYVFDAENRISGAAGFTYSYDAHGNRVEKSNGTSGTLYWYMTAGIVAESDLLGNLQSEYVFFSGERVARKDFSSSAVSYYFSDHLKTASVISDATGSSVKSESDYYPWGGELQFTNGDSNHYKFTGKERDAETGLDYFGARHYSNGLGRWITPDWNAKAAQVPYAILDDPQTLNLYSYVRNLPTSDLDTDGHASLAWERIKAVRIAWRQEQALVQKTGTGTRNWTPAQEAELLKVGKVKGFEGHHINNVKNNPTMAGNPDNIEFLNKNEHLATHGGNWRNPTTGQLLSRSLAVLQVADVIVNAVGYHQTEQLTGIEESLISKLADTAGMGPGFGSLYIRDPAKAAITLDGQTIDVFGEDGQKDTYDVRDGQYFQWGADKPTDPSKMKDANFEIYTSNGKL